MKKIVSIVLAACLILSMALPVFAGSWNIELRADGNRVRVGDYLKIRTDIDISTNKPWEVHWETSDSYIASVHDKGDDSVQIKGEHEGHVKITARLYVNDHEVDYDYYELDVTGYSSNSYYNNDGRVYVSGLTVTNPSLSLQPGGSGKIYAYVQPSNATNQGITYASNNNSVATVDASGVVRGISRGEAGILVKTAENGYSQIVYVTVSGDPVTQPVTPIINSTPQVVTPVTPAVPVINKHDPNFMFATCQLILAAAPNGQVNIPSIAPMSFDINVAAAMQMRKDVAVYVTFPYNGNTLGIKFPPGYNLTPYMSSGYVDWVVFIGNPNGTTVSFVR